MITRCTKPQLWKQFRKKCSLISQIAWELCIINISSVSVFGFKVGLDSITGFNSCFVQHCCLFLTSHFWQCSAVILILVYIRGFDISSLFKVSFSLHFSETVVVLTIGAKESLVIKNKNKNKWQELVIYLFLCLHTSFSTFDIIYGLYMNVLQHLITGLIYQGRFRCATFQPFTLPKKEHGVVCLYSD